MAAAGRRQLGQLGGLLVVAIMAILRTCRGSPLNGVVRNRSTSPVASSRVCIRAPTLTTLRVVVLAARAGRVVVPGQRRAHAGHLVRRDLLAVARPADDDAEAAGSLTAAIAARSTYGG
jgi:hypothetical protein